MSLVVVDYGLCNIMSVCNAFNHLGVKVKVSANPRDLQEADRAVLPGVGAFADGMKGLAANGLIEGIHDFVRRGRPLLGICLGMQMLMDQSHEFGLHQGLGLIPGEVKPLSARLKEAGLQLKVPHIGWNEIRPLETSWEGSILGATPVNTPVYFVHSFYVDPLDKSHTLAVTPYGDIEFSSVIAKDNVVGCQFHPEKSAAGGLKIL